VTDVRGHSNSRAKGRVNEVVAVPHTDRTATPDVTRNP